MKDHDNNSVKGF